jgi:hypothetical protein
VRADVIETPITIRFDGLDAAHHEIEIEAFAKSIKGFGRIIAGAANFAATENYIQHKDAMDVRVLVRPPEPNCVTVAAIVQWVESSAILSNAVGGLLVALITYIFARAANKREEMKHLRGALETAIKELGNRDQAVVKRLLGTVDKMADALKPATREAVNPIGRTAQRVTVSGGDPGVEPMVLGTAEREAIESRTPVEVTPEDTYEVLFTEMNLDKHTSRVLFMDGTDLRLPAEISDPAIQVPNNPYAVAFAAKVAIKVRAKATLRDGTYEKLHISNTA